MWGTKLFWGAAVLLQLIGVTYTYIAFRQLVVKILPHQDQWCRIDGWAVAYPTISQVLSIRRDIGRIFTRILWTSSMAVAFSAMSLFMAIRVSADQLVTDYFMDPTLLNIGVLLAMVVACFGVAAMRTSHEIYCTDMPQDEQDLPPWHQVSVGLMFFASFVGMLISSAYAFVRQKAFGLKVATALIVMLEIGGLVCFFNFQFALPEVAVHNEECNEAIRTGNWASWAKSSESISRWEAWALGFVVSALQCRAGMNTYEFIQFCVRPLKELRLEVHASYDAQQSEQLLKAKAGQGKFGFIQWAQRFQLRASVLFLVADIIFNLNTLSKILTAGQLGFSLTSEGAYAPSSNETCSNTMKTISGTVFPGTSGHRSKTQWSCPHGVIVEKFGWEYFGWSAGVCIEDGAGGCACTDFTDPLELLSEVICIYGGIAIILLCASFALYHVRVRRFAQVARQIGLSREEILDLTGERANDLSKLPPDELRERGWTLRDLLLLGCTTKELQRAGWTRKELNLAGCELAEPYSPRRN